MRIATAKIARPRKTAFVAIRVLDCEVAIASASHMARQMSNEICQSKVGGPRGM